MLGFGFPFEGWETVEEQLRNVGEGDGVAAGNAAASDLFQKIAEEEIDGGSGGEVLDSTEKLGGDGFVARMRRRSFAEMIGAEFGVLFLPTIGVRVSIVDQHAAAVASGICMLAMAICMTLGGMTFGRLIFGGVIFSGHGNPFRRILNVLQVEMLKV